ncbi:hypothetical protein EVAR_64874_1 [Eumeta japonica]|uniref:Uncharacterized protein n=1 Tax=Eumeta variegata TaxID=151549 RepID=A0A4C1ZJN2_EUMVA|nr:hypothetical protein EVAR_64874_1 [Eumeta japonica]
MDTSNLGKYQISSAKLEARRREKLAHSPPAYNSKKRPKRFNVTIQRQVFYTIVKASHPIPLEPADVDNSDRRFSYWTFNAKHVSLLDFRNVFGYLWLTVACDLY